MRTNPLNRMLYHHHRNTFYWIVVILHLLTMFSLWEEASAATTAPDLVDLPATRILEGVTLKKNGHGTRSINFFGWDIDVYVADLYSKVALLSEEDVFNSHEKKEPMQLDFTFLRTVDKGRVISAWTQQLDHSVSHKYEGYESDRQNFIAMFSNKIENGGTQTVKLIEDKTVIVDQGVHKGDIHGNDFQRAFLSMWFGEKAVGEELKANLLNGSHHLITDRTAKQVSHVPA